jgi:hypothetical protein
VLWPVVSALLQARSHLMHTLPVRNASAATVCPSRDSLDCLAGDRTKFFLYIKAGTVAPEPMCPRSPKFSSRLMVCKVPNPTVQNQSSCLHFVLSFTTVKFGIYGLRALLYSTCALPVCRYSN